MRRALVSCTFSHSLGGKRTFLAIAKQYGGLNNAAAALGLHSVNALQSAIMTFCEG